MLKDGRFYKEELPKIGKFYIPKLKEDNCTPEEQFVQNIILGREERGHRLLSKMLGYMLRI
jgi:hypothetical protein